MKFTDIEPYIQGGNYQVNVNIRYLQETLDDYAEGYGLELNPDFQRGHVWTEEQQIKYVEFFLRQGVSSRIIYFNSPEFGSKKGIDIDTRTIVCVDGLQRLTALLNFVNNKLKVFGYYYSEFEDKPNLSTMTIVFNVNSLTTKKDLLTWYIQLNDGGTPHSKEEIERVKNMLSSL